MIQFDPNMPQWAKPEKMDVTFADMSDAGLSYSIKVPADIDHDFSLDWWISVRGEKFYNTTLKPEGYKDDKSILYNYTLVFDSERRDLKRYIWVDIDKRSGVPLIKSYANIFKLDLKEFVAKFKDNLDFYKLSSRWDIRINPDLVIDEEKILINAENAFLWDVLQQLFELYEVRWVIEKEIDKLIIKIGYPASEIDHIFEYGGETLNGDGGLVKIERALDTEKLTTVLVGRGGDRNIPEKYYQMAGDNFEGDPDQNQYSASMFIRNLMPKCFRDYNRGWNSKVISPLESDAYNQGATDVSYRAIEWVESEDGIKNYGDIWDTLEPNEEIYPTIQNVTADMAREAGVVTTAVGRLDEIIAVSEMIGSDDPNKDITFENQSFEDISKKDTVELKPTHTFNFLSKYVLTIVNNYNSLSFRTLFETIRPDYYKGEITVALKNTQNGSLIIPESGNTFKNIPAGDYQLSVTTTVQNLAPGRVSRYENIVTSNVIDITIAYKDEDEEYFPTFDIWVKDIGFDLREPKYWASNEMTVMFSTGWLSQSDDYEFKIRGDKNQQGVYTKVYVEPDTSKVNERGERSAWRITLIKSDAEYNTLGKMLPNKETKPSAGDKFFFVYIELPHSYVQIAEKRQEDYLRAALEKIDHEIPIYSVTPDRIFCAQFSEIDKLKPGSRVRIANKKLIENVYSSLHIQSITLKFDFSRILPDWSMVITDKVMPTVNPIQRVSADISRLSNAQVTESNVIAKAASVLDYRYLRKDVSDRSNKKQSLLGGVETPEAYSPNYNPTLRAGWKLGIDDKGRGYLETNKIIADELQVDVLTYNKIQSTNGQIVVSSAWCTVTRSEILEDRVRVYYSPEDNLQQWRVGDQPRMMMGGRQFWGIVIETSGLSLEEEHWFECSIANTSHYVGQPDAIREGDDFVLYGHRGSLEENRKNITIISNGTESNPFPSVELWTNVTNFAPDENSCRIGYLSDKIKFGRGRSYLSWDQEKGMELRGRLVQLDPETGDEWMVGSISITGEQVFHYDSAGIPDKQNIFLIAEEKGFSSKIYDRRWQYSLNEEWVDIPGESNFMLTINNNAYYWLDRDVIAIRYLAVSEGFEYSNSVTVSKVYDGQKGDAGEDAISYWINLTATQIKKNAEGVLNPSSITAQAVSKKGSFPTSSYVGNWKYKTNLETNYNTATGVGIHIGSINKKASFIDIILYQEGSWIVELDRKTVLIQEDASDLVVGAINMAYNTGKTFKSLVDATSEENKISVLYPISTKLKGERVIVRFKVKVNSISGYIPGKSEIAFQISGFYNYALYETIIEDILAAPLGTTLTFEATRILPTAESLSTDHWFHLRTDFIKVDIEISEVMFVVGNKISPVWSPAPEDEKGRIVLRGNFTEGETYYNNTVERSTVRYSGLYYIYNGVDGVVNSWDDTKWDYYSANFENIATNFILAEGANIGGLIFQNERLESQSQDIYGNSNIIIDGNTGTAKVGILDIEENNVFINGGNRQIQITTNTIAQSDVVGGTIVLTNVGSFSPIQDGSYRINTSEFSLRTQVIAELDPPRQLPNGIWKIQSWAWYVAKIKLELPNNDIIVIGGSSARIFRDLEGYHTQFSTISINSQTYQSEIYSGIARISIEEEITSEGAKNIRPEYSIIGELKATFNKIENKTIIASDGFAITKGTENRLVVEEYADRLKMTYRGMIEPVSNIPYMVCGGRIDMRNISTYVKAGQPYTVTKLSVGKIRITHNLNDFNYIPIITNITTGETADNPVSVDNITTTTFDIISYSNPSLLTFEDTIISFMMIKGY